MPKSFVDRLYLVRLYRVEKKVRLALLAVVLLLLLLLANSAYLTLQSFKKNPSEPLSVISQSPPISLTPVATAAPTLIPTNITSPINSSAEVNQTSSVKEYFIPFGSGSSNASDWTDVPGLTAQVDFGSYPNIKEIHFEASIGIPTANESASVRLFNVTDKHPVWYSEITLVNGQFISSNPVIYDTGSKTYQVQMKTSLQYMANLIQSRLHIILQ